MRWAPRKAIDLGVQIAQGIAVAHERGIVHRDLKPQNVKIGRGGRVKVLDFGLAKRHAIASSQIGDATTMVGETQAGVVLGTVGDMAPEQVGGEPVDTRADIFAFGCVLHEMVTGQRAFARGSAVETMSAILHDAPAPPSRSRLDLPSGFDRLVAHCLAARREICVTHNLQRAYQ